MLTAYISYDTIFGNCIDKFLLEMNLRDYTLHAAKSRLPERLHDGPSNVTVLTYFFRHLNDGDIYFEYLKGAIKETWRHCGLLKTVIVTNSAHPSVMAFARRWRNVEIQEEPQLIPGNIDSMSIDCISRLWKRFKTDYVLIVQDDGFPLRAGIEEFLDSGYDFFGAPFCRNKLLPRIFNRLIHFAPMNGGFSLRSQKICRKAAQYWNRYYSGKEFCADFIEDNFYTNFLPRKHPLFILSTKPAPSDIALRFSFDGSINSGYLKKCPFGFHGEGSLSHISRMNLCRTPLG